MLYHIQNGSVPEACRNIELTFYVLLDQLHTGHDALGVEEALEAEHGTHAAFHPPVILFDNIVQVGASADLDGFFPTVIELVIHAHAGDAIATGQKPTLSRCGIGLSQRAKAFAIKFPFDVKAILPVGVDVRVACRRQMRHISVIDVVAFGSQLI
jgi:hypothetical protein